MRIAVTGAFGYSGRHITGHLLEAGHEVVTLTNSLDRPNPFGDKVAAMPFHFDEPRKLRASLEGVHTLVNTYWIRFDQKRFERSRAVANTMVLFRAAREAGVRRIVHISITNPDIRSPLPYFRGKAEHAIMEFERGQDYVYLHVEAPDECGHRAETENKVKSIELIDRDIIGPVWEYLEKHYQETGEDYRIMVLPDHPTPLALRTHTNAPVPFAAYSSDGSFKRSAPAYDEVTCQDSEVFILEGHTLFGRFIAGTIDG